MTGSRLALDGIFALFLVNGLLICAAMVAALATWGQTGEGAGMGVFALATTAIIPTLIAWLASTIRAFMKPVVPDVRLGATLATLHMLLWGALIAVGASGVVSGPPGWLLGVPFLGTGLYGMAATCSRCAGSSCAGDKRRSHEGCHLECERHPRPRGAAA